PYIHALSDLVIIRGPINPTEAVTVGTPTIMIHNDKIQDYEQDFFEDLSKNAISTGAARHLRSTKNLSSVADNLWGRTPKIPPYLSAVNSHGTPALSFFLRQLEDIIQESH
ncbi:MAG: hypothetical protein JWQ35_1440, partial [Bacteriovoracaceae bacterium]|nr:hypothetical protein [Bacteriovoracaceae bacterium]